MKKTKINLLTNREDYQKINLYFKYFRTALLFFSLACFAAVILFYFSNASETNKYNVLVREKTHFTKLVNQNKVQELKLNFINRKYSALQDFSREDAKFLPYYNKLSSLLIYGTEEANLRSFDINKIREVNFMVSFDDFTDVINFFGLLESDKFLSSFDTLIIKGFSIFGDELTKKKNYDLTFFGKFKELKNEITD